MPNIKHSDELIKASARDELTRAGDDDLLGADNNDLLAAKKLLSDGRSETAEEVALAIDDNLLLEHLSLFQK